MLSSQEQMEIIKGALAEGYRGPIFKLIESASLKGEEGQEAPEQRETGGLVQSYASKPPSIGELPTGQRLKRGDVLENAENYKSGGFKKYDHGGPHDTDPPDKKGSGSGKDKFKTRIEVDSKDDPSYIAFTDSLDVYNRQNMLNQEFINQFPTVQPSDHAGSTGGGFMRMLDELKETASNAGSIIPNSKETYREIMGDNTQLPDTVFTSPASVSDSTRNRQYKLYAGTPTTNAEANSQNYIESLVPSWDDTEDADQKFNVTTDGDIRTKVPYINTDERGGFGVSQGLAGMVHPYVKHNQGFPVREVISPNIEPVSHIPTYHTLPFGEGSKSAPPNVDPDSWEYDANTLMKVNLPQYKKPTREVVIKENKKISENKASNKKPEKKKISKKKIIRSSSFSDTDFNPSKDLVEKTTSKPRPKPSPEYENLDVPGGILKGYRINNKNHLVKKQSGGFKKYKKGGPDIDPPKPITPATRADSLEVHNSSLNFLQAMQDMGYEKGDPKPFDNSFLNFSNGYIKPGGRVNLSSLVANDKGYDLDPHIITTGQANTLDEIGPGYPFIQKQKEYKYKVAENMATLGYNTDLPLIELDARIKPQYTQSFSKPGNIGDAQGGDLASFGSYDPLAVKPRDLLTDDEMDYMVANYPGFRSPAPIAPPKPAGNPSYSKAYKNVDKADYPTLESFIKAAESYKKTGSNTPPIKEESDAPRKSFSFSDTDPRLITPPRILRPKQAPVNSGLTDAAGAPLPGYKYDGKSHVVKKRKNGGFIDREVLYNKTNPKKIKKTKR